MKKIIPDMISTSEKMLFVIENVLTEKETNTLIEQSEPHYKKLDDEYLVSERDSYRVLSKDNNFAEILYTRIKEFVIDDKKYNNKINRIPCGFGVDHKEWTIDRINPCFRFCKYVPGSTGFLPHRDATYIENEDNRSILTIIIYLNDSDADTIFYKTTTKRKIYQTVQDEMNCGYYERCRISPKRGSVLIFNHNMIHAGDKISIDSDNKYIIRSDIIYKCINRHSDYNYSWMNDKYFLEAIELYREAFNQELDGNLVKASKLYQKANALRQFHKEDVKLK
jgi:hypothetical protein